MYELKSIKLYLFSILKLFFLNFRNFYYKTNYYNKRLITFTPERIFYSPSTYLLSSLTSTGSDFYKISSTSPILLWNTKRKEKLKFENLHSFFWLTKLNRKNSKTTTHNIIKSWIDLYFNYHPYTWEMEITARRIIAWSSNTDISLENSDRFYKKKFFLSLIKQSNFLLKNLNRLPNESGKIICCSAIILSGMMFKENESSYKEGIRELEKIVKNYFDESGFPKSRNPEDVFVCLKYLILIREWLKEAQRTTPDFLNEIIAKSGNCYKLLCNSNNKLPLFNGATEVDHKDFDTFLKNLKYRFSDKKNEASDIIKIKKKKFEFFIDCGNPPPNNYCKNYQAGCLSFELISNKQKIICNTGYGKYFSQKLISASRSTAAHSTLYINDTSSCIFQKNRLINEIYGNSIIQKHKVISKVYSEDKDFYFISASHNGYEKKFGYTHERSIKIFKKNDKIHGQDKLKKTKNVNNLINYFIRFHIYPDTKIVKTKAGNSVLISLPNGEGWFLECKDNPLNIEKNIFLGNKNKIMNNESVSISGEINKELISIEWQIEKLN
tara:strand:+ start:715 stop:2370 length:1656 start_codon:yes stop_codon:yes gene_type:complete